MTPTKVIGIATNNWVLVVATDISLASVFQIHVPTLVVVARRTAIIGRIVLIAMGLIVQKHLLHLSMELLNIFNFQMEGVNGLDVAERMVARILYARTEHK